MIEFEDWDDELQWQKYANFYALSPDFMQSLGSKAWWEPGEYHIIFYCYYPEKEHSAGVFCTMNWFKCNGGVGITVPLTKELATLPTQWGWRMLAHESVHSFYSLLNLIYHKNIPDIQDQLYQEYRKLHPNPTEDELTGLSDMLFEKDIKPHLNLILQDLPEKRTGEILYGIIAVLNGIIALFKKKLTEGKEKEKQSVVKRLANAIAVFEGFFQTGTLPNRLNNPGALIYIGQSKAVKDKSGFAHFLTKEDGWNALYYQLQLIFDGKSKYYRPDMTIQEFINVYASSSPENEKVAYAEYIANHFGVDVNTKLNQLT